MRSRLIKLRKQRGMTQQKVACELGITRSFYGMIETGNRNPTLDLARRITVLLQATDIEDVFFDNLSNESLQNKTAQVG